MTLEVAKMILRSGNCQLPNYKTAKDHHLLIFESFANEFLKHSNNFGKQDTGYLN